MTHPLTPRCPQCGDVALDGHLTCGRAACEEGRQRAQRQRGPLTCLAYREDGTLCGELATTVDPERMIMVCAAHAIQPEEQAT